MCRIFWRGAAVEVEELLWCPERADGSLGQGDGSGEREKADTRDLLVGSWLPSTPLNEVGHQSKGMPVVKESQ